MDNPQWHWSTISRVRPGEFVVICRDGEIAGLAHALAPAIADQAQPGGFRQGNRWHQLGWLLPVSFVLFKVARSRDQLTDGLFQEKVLHSPLFNDPATGRGRGAQIYLTEVRDADALPLFERIASILDRDRPGWLVTSFEEPAVVEAQMPGDSTETTSMALREARVGQGRFRKNLIEFWGGRCCATGLDVSDLLVASHIHPWFLASNQERLDPFNGLLLAAHYDKAFDRGLITLDEDGRWQVVGHLTDDQLARAGLSDLQQRRIRGLDARHIPYIRRHRERVISQPAG